MERRLAAILAADAVGYSRLMAADEAGTHMALRDHLREVISPKIEEYHGRIVKLTGDGALAEFASVVNAVVCGAEIQHMMTARNSEVHLDSQIAFRIGINVGDILIDADDIFGDGVNIASRLEGLAEPGGICLSGDAYRQVRGKIEAKFEDLGDRQVKNMVEPLRVYRITMDPSSSAVTLSETTPSPLTDNPTIAVLPFKNMSDDPEQSYFSDGITQDIITEIGRFGIIDVVAQSSTFVYRDHVTDLSEAGKVLGARYLVKGSIRRALDRVRLNAQLIDARTGKQTWGDRFDCKLDDIFDIQDELVHQIVATLVGRVQDADTERAVRRQPDNLAAYDCYLRADHSLRWDDADHSANGLKFARQAVMLDPSFAIGHAILAICLVRSNSFKDADDQDHHHEALNIAQRAIELGPDDSLCHQSLAIVCLEHREHERACYHIERALALNPHDRWIWDTQAFYLTTIGKHEAALDILIEKDTVEPFPTNSHWENRGSALFGLGRYEEAAASFEHMTHLNYWNHAQLASCFGQLGNVERARAHWAEVLEVVPNATPSIIGEEYPYKYQADEDQWADGLRRANLNDLGPVDN